VFKPIPDDAVRVAALQNGEVDVAVNIPPHSSAPYQGPTADRRVRQAISYAIDVEDAAAVPLYQQLDLYGASKRLDWKARSDELIKAYDMSIKETKESGRRFDKADRAARIRSTGGRNSVAECQLPKLDVAGSNPVGRSTASGGYGHRPVTPFESLTFFRHFCVASERPSIPAPDGRTVAGIAAD
jgi:hypothetical protein